MDNTSYPQTMDLLKDLGDPRHTWKWAHDEQNYLADLGLSAEHVPDLIQIARLWLDWFHGDGTEPDEPQLWAPIHAWRSLGQLQAAEAVQPLLDMMAGLKRIGDDWYMEEFPDVFARIGPAAMEPLRQYLGDHEHGLYPRSIAAGGLRRMAQRQPECRERVVSILGDMLADCQQHSPALNGFIIAYLLDLKAVEQAETIEHAFAAGRVDDDICGFWGEVRKELGSEGMGLAPDQPPGRTRHHENHFRIDQAQSTEKRERIRRRKRQEKLKAKRKQRQKAQKQNRKK